LKRFNKKVKQYLIKEMLYGIQASKEVKLSNISRMLKEEQSCELPPKTGPGDELE
jgi:hypothetical protein